MANGMPDPKQIEALSNQVKDLSEKLAVLEQSMETQEERLKGDIKELKTATEKDFGNLKSTVTLILTVVGILIAVAGVVLTSLSRAGVI